MKTATNPVVTVAADGKSATIVVAIEDLPFNENIITRVTHPHQDIIADHVRHVQSSNAGVFVRHRGISFIIPNDALIAIGAAIEPGTSFPPKFHQGDKLVVHSELPATLQWQVSDNAFPVADKPHTTPPPAVWTNLAGQTAASLADSVLAEWSSQKDALVADADVKKQLAENAKAAADKAIAEKSVLVSELSQAAATAAADAKAAADKANNFCKWIRVVATNAAGTTISKPVQVK